MTARVGGRVDTAARWGRQKRAVIFGVGLASSRLAWWVWCCRNGREGFFGGADFLNVRPGCVHYDDARRRAELAAQQQRFAALLCLSGPVTCSADDRTR